MINGRIVISLERKYLDGPWTSWKVTTTSGFVFYFAEQLYEKLIAILDLVGSAVSLPRE